MTSEKQKGLKMTKASNTLTSLLHRLGAGRRVRFDASTGTGASKITAGSGAPAGAFPTGAGVPASIPPSHPRPYAALGTGFYRPLGMLFSLRPHRPLGTPSSLRPHRPLALRPHRLLSLHPHRPLRTLLTTAALATTLATLATLASAPPASANSPWWHLTQGARPTYLHPGAATNEVQEVTVTAKGGEFDLDYEFEEEPGSVFPEFDAALPYDVTAAEFQTALEGEHIFGADNVEVQPGKGFNAKGEPEPAAEVHSWKLLFKGTQNDRPVTAPLLKNSGYGHELKLGGTAQGTVTDTVLTEGRADGELVANAENIGNAPVQGGGCVKVALGSGKWKNSECSEPAGPEPSEAGEYEKTTLHILDKLPPGLKAVGVSGSIPNGNSAQAIPCTVVTESPTSLVSCEVTGKLAPFAFIEVRIAVDVTGEAPANSVNKSEENEIEVTGGQTAPAHLLRPVELSSAPEPFGVEDYELVNEEEGGAPDEQAGSHPFQQTLTLNLNETADTNSISDLTAKAHPVALTKELHFKWPPGLIGNPLAVPRCPIGEFLQLHNGGGSDVEDSCPADTAVGVQRVSILEPLLGVLNETQPLFSLEPEAGEAARFGFLVIGTPVIVDISVRAGEDYGITVEAHNIPEKIAFLSSTTTVWGDPGAPSHNDLRGWRCFSKTSGGTEGCEEPQELRPAPFLALPTSCTGPVKTGVEAQSWQESNEQDAKGLPQTLLPAVLTTMPGLDGCNQLPFKPSIEVTPDVPDASSSTGLKVNVRVPQEDSLNPEGLADADIRDTTVALPQGVAINPSGGDGLEACPNNLIGYEGNHEYEDLPGIQTPVFTPRIPGGVDAKQAGEQAPLEPGINFCSTASKIGTVRIKVPVLEHELTGAVYLAPQEANPFGSLLAMYIVAEDPFSGVLVKLPGEVQLCKGAGEVINGQTCQGLGQIITTFLNTPQAPAEEIELHFFGGEKAPLATPSRCGPYTTTTSIEPWSGNAPAHPSATFPITAGPSGGACPGAQLPFSPYLTGGATNIQAGAFSPFTLTMTRQNGEQNMQSVEAHLPLGMSGDLSNVEQCPEPQANLGTCGPNSLIGETTVSVGVGGKPFTVSGGKFYLTGPYNGTGACSTPGTNGCAPFGVTFEVPAKAGPFDLAKTKLNHPSCDCVLVRGKIEVNPETAAITVTSNPPGTPDAIPTSIEGIPLEIQHINATTTRGNFQFNPTNCEKLDASGTIHSSEGGLDTVNVPFQVTNCADLKFEPKISISTQGKTSKADGASLTYKVGYPNVPQGTDADIHYVKVELPKALPSRLTTLQKACTQAQFKSNPAGCPAASAIGHAKAIVPNIPVPLEGPVYFVSNGGEAFPNLVIVLQGYNVRIDLIGDTFISKSGITSTTFHTVPDNPVYTFEITLPEGPYSALAANGNLCKETTTKTVSKKVKVKVKGREKTEVRKVKEQVAAGLSMPNEYIAQNGMKINTTVPISVTGCGKTATKTQKTKKKKKAGNKRRGK
jgi:hypothetical protein